MSDLNVMTHDFVPEHWLLSKKDTKEVLDKYGIAVEQLPKIRKSDAIITFLERVEGDIPIGSVIHIRRKSEISGVTETYRVVVE